MSKRKRTASKSIDRNIYKYTADRTKSINVSVHTMRGGVRL